MKLKTKRNLLFVLVVLTGIAIIAFAIVKSNEYNTAVGAKITQQSIKQKLSRPVVAPKVPVSKPTAHTQASMPPPVVSGNLLNTGAGDVIWLFVSASTIGTLLYGTTLRYRSCE